VVPQEVNELCKAIMRFPVLLLLLVDEGVVVKMQVLVLFRAT
jgi:hypothetical protein